MFISSSGIPIIFTAALVYAFINSSTAVPIHPLLYRLHRNYFIELPNTSMQQCFISGFCETHIVMRRVKVLCFYIIPYYGGGGDFWVAKSPCAATSSPSFYYFTAFTPDLYFLQTDTFSRHGIFLQICYPSPRGWRMLMGSLLLQLLLWHQHVTQFLFVHRCRTNDHVSNIVTAGCVGPSSPTSLLPVRQSQKPRAVLDGYIMHHHIIRPCMPL